MLLHLPHHDSQQIVLRHLLQYLQKLNRQNLLRIVCMCKLIHHSQILLTFSYQESLSQK